MSLRSAGPRGTRDSERREREERVVTGASPVSGMDRSRRAIHSTARARPARQTLDGLQRCFAQSVGCHDPDHQLGKRCECSQVESIMNGALQSMDRGAARSHFRASTAEGAVMRLAMARDPRSGIEAIALEISGLLLLELAGGADGRGPAGEQAVRARENLADSGSPGTPATHRSWRAVRSGRRAGSATTP